MTSGRNQAISVMRIIAICSVVLIHTTTRSLEAAAFDLPSMKWGLFLNQSARFAVPLFFMISGFVLELSYKNNRGLLDYLAKRLSRIFVPYLFWSFIYYFFVYRTHTVSYFISLFYGSSSYQLYFIPTLLIFYLTFPLLHSFSEFLSKKRTLLILFILQVVFLYRDYYVSHLQLYYPLAIALMNFFLFIAGIVSARHQEQLRQLIKGYSYLFLVMLIISCSVIFHQAYSYFMSTKNYLWFYSQWRPSILIYSLSVFALLFKYINRNIIDSKMVEILSGLSFFVFFIHVIVLESVWQYLGKFLVSSYGVSIVSNFWFDPLYFCVVLGFSYFVAYLVHKVPWAAYISG